MANTGYKGWTTLQQYYTDDNTATGITKANTVGGADYIAPVSDTTGCTLTTYYSAIYSETAIRNNCSNGYDGSIVTLATTYGQFTSTASQNNADAQAIAYVKANKQSYANSNGTCNYVYYSAIYSESIRKNDCVSGYGGSSVTLSTTYGQFTSTVSQAAANSLAVAWVQDNKQAYANANGTCSIKTTCNIGSTFPGIYGYILITVNNIAVLTVGNPSISEVINSVDVTATFDIYENDEIKVYVRGIGLSSEQLIGNVSIINRVSFQSDNLNVGPIDNSYLYTGGGDIAIDIIIDYF